MKTKLLFICTSNVCRSVTAESMFVGSNRFEAKSAGTKPYPGRNAITQELLDWADVIVAMDEKEDGHLTFLKSNFKIDGKTIYVLDVPDIYDEDKQEDRDTMTAIFKEKLTKLNVI